MIVCKLGRLGELTKVFDVNAPNQMNLGQSSFNDNSVSVLIKDGNILT